MFKEQFKYYKSKNPPPNLDLVINLNLADNRIVNRTHNKIAVDDEKLVELSGLKPSASWNIFEIIDHPGLILIQNPFTDNGSQIWIERCLSSYPGPPNKCNLHNHDLLDINENWWDVCQTDETRKEKILEKLRWVTLGYHHDWDTKVYSEKSKSPIPEELKSLVLCLGKVAGGWDISAEAAILNFYRMDSTLSGHTDHSEPDDTAPLVSISFGQSAIFLIGGKTLDDPTTPILLNNGDVMIMSGDSRLCYHGVPRILPSAERFGRNDVFTKFLRDARINLNIRQVLKPGQNRL